MKLQLLHLRTCMQVITLLFNGKTHFDGASPWFVEENDDTLVVAKSELINLFKAEKAAYTKRERNEKRDALKKKVRTATVKKAQTACKHSGKPAPTRRPVPSELRSTDCTQDNVVHGYSECQPFSETVHLPLAEHDAELAHGMDGDGTVLDLAAFLDHHTPAFKRKVMSCWPVAAGVDAELGEANVR
jgi:hypothetical protein